MANDSAAAGFAPEAGLGQAVALLEIGSDRSPMRAREDYVKALFQLGETGPVKAAELARYLGISRVSVSKAKRLLERDGLVIASNDRLDRLRLTAQGRKLGIAMVRRHRLVETFLHSSLAVPLERVHAEAERIEHAISDDIALRLAQMLGHPDRDPHGHKIPYSDDDSCSDHLTSLESVAVGTRVRVVSLDDRDDEAVRSLVVAGLLPGSTAVVEKKGPHTIVVRSAGRKIHLLVGHAAMVRIEPR